MRSSYRSFLIIGLLAVAGSVAGCGATDIRPVDIFPEDNCAHCRMAVSNERFASEIIEQDGTALKFDDIGCLMNFKSKKPNLKIAAIYLKDYETKEWIPYERAAIVETDVETPMGSGRVAFADGKRARAFQEQHPKSATAGHDACCK